MQPRRDDERPQPEPVRCPRCGSVDPGFLDSDHDRQIVRCPNRTCQARSPWRAWKLCGALAEGLLELDGDYTLGRTSAAVSIFFEAKGGPRIELGAIDLDRGVAYLPKIGDGRHGELVDLLESLDLTIEHEGYVQ